jgi:DNA-binding GntR family transcriptional regulator
MANAGGKELALNVSRIEVPASLSEMAYEALKESLMKMDASGVPDEGRLDERELALRLGVSRTPLREAVNRLVTEGFLRVVPRKGVFVVKKSKREVVEILQVRAALEGMAARLATEHVTEKDVLGLQKIFAPFDMENVDEQILKYADANVKFHEFVLKISQCGKLIELANNLFDHIRMIRFQTISFEGRARGSLREHLAIIQALENRDQDLAEKLMREHIEGLAEHVEKNVDSIP